MAWIGKDWQIGEFVSERKIGPRLAPDWHGLTWIDMDWHGLARIGKLANLCRSEKLTPDWHRIGMNWHGLARIVSGLAQDWHRIGSGLAPDWHLSGSQLAQDSLRIGTRLASDWPPIG